MSYHYQMIVDMKPHKVSEFVHLMKERNFQVEGRRFEVMGYTPEGLKALNGVVSFYTDDEFRLKWRKRQTFLRLMSQLDFEYIMFDFLPYCMGFRRMPLFKVDDEMGRQLEIVKCLE